MKIVFACWAGAEYQGRILTEMGAERRLVSYFDLRDHKVDPIPEYHANGKAGKPTKKAKAA